MSAPAQPSAIVSVKRAIAIVLLAALSAIGAMCLPATAEAVETSVVEIGTDHLFDRSGFDLDMTKGRVSDLTVENPHGTPLQTLDGWPTSRENADGTRSGVIIEKGVCGFVRIPVPAGKWGDDAALLSTEKGQKLLDDMRISITWSDIGTYAGRPVQLTLTVSDMVDCLPRQRYNNVPYDFTLAESERLTNGAELFGAQADEGRGYEFFFSPDRSIEECFFLGVESCTVNLEYRYDDGSPIELADGETLLTTVGQLDADHLGVEGVRLNDAAEVYLSENTSLVRGDITAQSGWQDNAAWSPSLHADGYIDGPTTATFFGTQADGALAAGALNAYDGDARSGGFHTYFEAFDAVGYDDWLDAGLTYRSTSSTADTSFTLIDTVGGIAFPLTSATITSVAPAVPVKTVDKTKVTPGEALTYTVEQTLNDENVDCTPGFRYTSLSMEDVLDPRLHFERLSVLDADGTDISDRGTTVFENGTLRFDFDEAYLRDLVLDGRAIRFVIETTVDAEAEAGTIENTASTIPDGTRLTGNTTHTSVDRSDVAIDKSVDFERGDTAGIVYRILIENRQPGSVAENVDVIDDSLPEGFTVDPQSVRLEGVSDSVELVTSIAEDGTSIGETKPNGADTEVVDGRIVKAHLDYLPNGSPVTLTFSVDAPDTAVGTEIFNTAGVTFDGGDGKRPTTQDTDGTWVNRPQLSVLKTAGSDVCPVGGSVDYRVVVENTAPGTVARDVTVTDGGLPAGMTIDRDSIVVDGVTEHVTMPIDGDGVHAEQQVDNAYRLTYADNSFSVHLDYLPAEGPVTIEYRATASADVGGSDVRNVVTVDWDGGTPVEDEAIVTCQAVGAPDGADPGTDDSTRGGLPKTGEAMLGVVRDWIWLPLGAAAVGGSAAYVIRRRKRTGYRLFDMR